MTTKTDPNACDGAHCHWVKRGAITQYEIKHERWVCETCGKDEWRYAPGGFLGDNHSYTGD